MLTKNSFNKKQKAYDPYGEKREQERLQKEQARKEKATGILNPQLPYDTNRAFGLLAAEDDSYNYEKHISNPSGALNGFLGMIKLQLRLTRNCLIKIPVGLNRRMKKCK